MQTPTIILFLSLIYINYGDAVNYGKADQPTFNEYSACKRYENKVYAISVTFPGMRTLYAGLRLLADGAFDEIFSIGAGHNQPELGVSFALSHRVGYYQCLERNYMRLTGFGFLYRNESVPMLATNGATVIHDYYFQFSNDYKTCKGVVKFAVFPAGTNPFTTRDAPVHVGDLGQVTCELLKFRTYFDLTRSI